VRDLVGAAPSATRVEWDVRPIYDFVFSLSDDAGATGDIPAPDRRWLEAHKAELTKITGDALRIYGDELCVTMAGLAVDRPEVRTAADFVDLAHDASDREILTLVLGEDFRNPDTADLAERAVDGDPEAVEQLLAKHGDFHNAEKQARFAAIYRSPRTILGPARGVLAAWLEHFAQIEDRVTRMIERDYQQRADARRTLSGPELIEQTTGGIRFVSEPGIDRVILAPSYFARPYNFLLGSADWRMFGYPIADSALDGVDPLAPPQSVVRLHRALGDETRLRILRLLRDRDLYLTEIAQILELSKPTIKHHLALLRSAGLVTLTEEAGLTYYSLRRDSLDAASSELKQFLLD
jgi:DNA-binding transcriptional ArsR family regulator